MSERDLDLPAPFVRFAPGFAARLERLVLRVHARSDRLGGAARSLQVGSGHEFTGYRNYEPGEDPRALDWNLLARLDRPFVRTSRLEAGQRWLVLVDVSASMGVGPPGKLQLAAECALGILAIALRERARARLTLVPGPSIEIASRARLPQVRAFLEAAHAHGRMSGAGLAAALARRSHDRVIVLSDLAGLEPRDLALLSQRGTRFHVVQILAPQELAPTARGSVAWRDAESAHEVPVNVDAALDARYQGELERWIASCRALLARARARHAVASSRESFEDVVSRVFANGA